MENKFLELNELIGQPNSDVLVVLGLKGWKNLYSGDDGTFPNLSPFFGVGDVLLLVSEGKVLREIHSIVNMEELNDIHGEEIDILYFEN